MPRSFPLMRCLTPILLCGLTLGSSTSAEQSTQVSQYGITWTFDQAHEVGQFVNGDTWVVGPVTITSVTPPPGPSNAQTGPVKSIYGDVALTDDARMRNGSMVLASENSQQGYDSRLQNYDTNLSIHFPLDLKPRQSLISTISNTKFPVTVLHEALMWTSEKTSSPALKTAAILTCLDKAPPPNAFRPAYAGKDTKLYTTDDIHWERLPALPTVKHTPNWEQFERYFQRPWLDHAHSWVMLYTGPSENQVNYGREFSRVGSIASLMLMLDVPQAQKEKLMIGYLQWGIDVAGLAENGREWIADGGHWNGRKWPLIFTSLMLDDIEMQLTIAETVFSEDQQTYYGPGWNQETALFQMVFHTHTYGTYEERPPSTWGKDDKRQESYRVTVSGGLPGTALAAQLMGAKALWNHDAFFDYYDRWMAPIDPNSTIERPKQEGHSNDPFVDAMWQHYRASVPEQAGAESNQKWIWTQGRSGKFVDNPTLEDPHAQHIIKSKPEGRKVSTIYL